jgi:hypothetical protein
MANQDFTIERKSYKHNWYGIAGTTLIHGLIFAFLFFYALYPPNPPLEFEGMMMSLGDENMGGPATSPQLEPAPNEQFVPISEATDEQTLSAETDESVAIKETEKSTPKEKPNKVEPKSDKKTPQLALPKKVNQQALFKKKNNQTGEGGYGDGLEPGNEGSPDGSPDGDKDGRGLGDSGYGTSDKGPDGVQIEMGGRKVKMLPNIEDNSRATGKVVVRIVVNRDGEVIKAVPGQVGSNTTDVTLLQKSKEGAMKTKFVARGDGPEEQYGYMTFIYKYRP